MASSQAGGGRRVDWFAAGLGLVLAVVVQLVGGTVLFGGQRWDDRGVGGRRHSAASHTNAEHRNRIIEKEVTGMQMENGSVEALGSQIVENVSRVLVGKEAEIELCVIALLSRGHILIEDVPGVGKTMLAKSLARSLGCSFERLQFTPDLLPSDVTGVNIYSPSTQQFAYRQGPP